MFTLYSPITGNSEVTFNSLEDFRSPLWLPTSLDIGPRTLTLAAQLRYLKDQFNSSNVSYMVANSTTRQFFFHSLVTTSWLSGIITERGVTSNSQGDFLYSLVNITPSSKKWMIPLLHFTAQRRDLNNNIVIRLFRYSLTADDRTSTLVSVEATPAVEFTLPSVGPASWTPLEVNDWISFLGSYEDHINTFVDHFAEYFTRNPFFNCMNKCLSGKFRALLSHCAGGRAWNLKPQQYNGRTPTDDEISETWSLTGIAMRRVLSEFSEQITMDTTGVMTNSPQFIVKYVRRQTSDFPTTPMTPPTQDDTFTRIRRSISQQLNYTANPNQYIPGTITLEGERNPWTFGVELEVSTNYTARQLVDFQERPFFICKDDSSIQGNKAERHELVTVPMSLEAQRHHWALFFDKIDLDKFDTSRKTNNGMHIHVDRARFSESQEKFIPWFFVNRENHEFLRLFSERDARSMYSYAKLPTYNDREYPSKIRAFNNASLIAQGAGRAALNLTSSKPTWEFRLFKGIVSYAEMEKNFDFLEALLQWTDAFEMNFQKAKLRNFIEFISRTPDTKWETLKEYLELLGIDEIVLESEYSDIEIPTGKPPKVILESITTRQVPITRILLERLNEASQESGVHWGINSKGVLYFREATEGSRVAQRSSLSIARRLGKLKDEKLKAELFSSKS